LKNVHLMKIPNLNLRLIINRFNDHSTRSDIDVMKFFSVVLIMLMLCANTPASAQTYKKYLRKGDRAYKYEDYETAVKFYRRALKLREGNAKATYKLGLAHLYGPDKLPALQYLKKVYALSPNIDKKIEYQLGMAYIYHEKFDDARRFFESFSTQRHARKTNVQDRIQQCIHADSLMQQPIHAVIEPVNEVNSAFHDYTPLVYDQGNRMVLTSNRPGGKRSRDGSYYEDIYITEKASGERSKPVRIGAAVNVTFHDAAGTISPDEKKRFVYYEYEGGNIYVSKRQNDGWGEPVPLDEGINTIFWETSASITADGNTIYFASERPDGYGGLDIYKSEMGNNGKWMKPVNLGPTVNTAFNEDSPYITPDGTRLYFGSAGHPGMGAEDIFYTDIREGKPGKPVNLGYPINSIYLDNYFVPAPDGNSGYFASMRPGGKGMADIFHVQFEAKPAEMIATADTPAREVIPVANEDVVQEETEDLEDQAVTVLKGKVIDAKSGEPLNAEVKLVDNSRNEVLMRVNSDPKDGAFEIIIPYGGNFGVSTRRQGYLFNSLNFDLPEFEEYQEVDTHILMRRAETGSKVVLKNIFFDFGKSELRTESLGELDRIRELLTDNPGLVVQINGHTDNVGDAWANKILSKKRADAVVTYLINNGIDQSRLSAKGFGEERPLVSNDDEVDGREINRRTEIEIIRNSDESSTSP